MAADVPVPVDGLEVGGLGLGSAGGRVGEGIVDPTLTEVGGHAIELQDQVGAEVVRQNPPRYPFQRRIGWEDDGAGGPGHIRHFVDEDVGRSAHPALVFVEGPASLLESDLPDELVGALNKGLDVLGGAHGAGHDGAVLARIVGGQSR